MSDSMMSSPALPYFTNTITDGTPGGNNGLVQAPLARCSVSSGSQTILSHMRRTISATVKRKWLFAKFVLLVEYEKQSPTGQRLALRNMTKIELKNLFELSQKLRPHDADRFKKNMSRLEKPLNIAQKRRYREHEFV